MSAGWAFIVGVFIGANIGILMAAIAFAARRDTPRQEKLTHHDLIGDEVPQRDRFDKRV